MIWIFFAMDRRIKTAVRSIDAVSSCFRDTAGQREKVSRKKGGVRLTMPRFPLFSISSVQKALLTALTIVSRSSRVRSW